MPTATPALPPKPDPSVPVVGPDGKINPDWNRYLTRLDELVRALRLEIP
jgi:hypothetical protein